MTDGRERDGYMAVMTWTPELSEQQTADLVKRMCSKRSRFSLWGNPIKLGPRKYQIYGADREFWKPVKIEVADSQITILGKWSDETDVCAQRIYDATRTMFPHLTETKLSEAQRRERP